MPILLLVLQLPVAVGFFVMSPGADQSTRTNSSQIKWLVGWVWPATRERIINVIEPFSADSKETPLAMLAISAFVLRYTSRSSTASTIRTHTDFTITLDLIAFATFMTSCTRCTVMISTFDLRLGQIGPSSDLQGREGGGLSDEAYSG